MPATRADRPSSGGNMSSFEDSLASKPFLFVVGEERKAFHIHKDLIGQLSPALNALINGRMKEAREGRVEWPDLQVETFVRFAKYAYSRDYAEADPEMLPRPPAPEVPEQQDQSSQTQMIDLTDQTDNDGSSIDHDGVEDDEQGSSSIEDESSDEAIEYDDDEEEEEEEEGEEMYDEEGDDDMDEASIGQGGEYDQLIQVSIRSPAQVSSTLSNNQPSIQQEFKSLPFSIKGYIDSWEAYLRNILLTEPRSFSDNPYPPAKRRLLNSGECRSASSANLKYGAMRRFVGLEIEHPDDRWEPRPNIDAYENYESVFMSHVNLYALAEKYGVEKLKILTLHRLHLALVRFTIFSERVNDVACIVPIIYEYTVADDMARKMIVQFFCCVAEDVKKSKEFRTVLRSVGEFADDLFQEVTSRLL